MSDWFVDERCINCAASRHVAPDVLVEAGGQSVFAQRPQTAAQLRQAWLAVEVCPTRSVRAPRGERPPPDLYPLEITPGVFLCGHNHPASYGAHSWFVPRPDGNLLVDAPRFVQALVRRFEAAGGVGRILLTHRDDVADAERFARHFGAEVFIHRAEADAAPYATHLLEGQSPARPTTIGEGLVAIPVPGHTEGSVVYRVDERWLFTGDSLAWDPGSERLRAFRDACWYSWSAQRASLGALCAHRFGQVFAGHGRWSPALEPGVMADALRALVARM